MLTCQQEQMSISVYKTNVCLVSLLLPFHYSAWKWVSPDQISHLFGRLVSELRDTDSLTQLQSLHAWSIICICVSTCVCVYIGRDRDGVRLFTPISSTERVVSVFPFLTGSHTQSLDTPPCLLISKLYHIFPLAIFSVRIKTVHLFSSSKPALSYRDRGRRPKVHLISPGHFLTHLQRQRTSRRQKAQDMVPHTTTHRHNYTKK